MFAIRCARRFAEMGRSGKLASVDGSARLERGIWLGDARESLERYGPHQCAPQVDKRIAKHQPLHAVQGRNGKG
eukprot:5020326-Pyramimonas_sp.AAC.1